MALELRDCRFTGPALPEPYVRGELEAELARILHECEASCA